MTNCPNCGAPIISNKCEYCGTVHKRVTSCHETLKCEVDKLRAINNALKTEVLYEQALMAMRHYAI